MQNEERAWFFKLVQTYISKDPEAAAHVATFVQEGLSQALRESNDRAADLEVALAILASRKYQGSEALVLDKLKKWEGRTALRWDWLIQKLTGVQS